MVPQYGCDPFPFFGSALKQPKEKVFGQKILGTPGTHTSGYPWPWPCDVPDENFMQGAFCCCLRQAMAGISRDLGRDVPGSEELYASYFSGAKKDSQSQKIWTIRGVTGHYPVKEGFGGKSHQKAHPNVQQNLCHTVSVWFNEHPRAHPMRTRPKADLVWVYAVFFPSPHEAAVCPPATVAKNMCVFP